MRWTKNVSSVLVLTVDRRSRRGTSGAGNPKSSSTASRLTTLTMDAAPWWLPHSRVSSNGNQWQLDRAPVPERVIYVRSLPSRYVVSLEQESIRRRGSRRFPATRGS